LLWAAARCYADVFQQLCGNSASHLTVVFLDPLLPHTSVSLQPEEQWLLTDAPLASLWASTSQLPWDVSCFLERSGSPASPRSSTRQKGERPGSQASTGVLLSGMCVHALLLIALRRAILGGSAPLSATVEQWQCASCCAVWRTHKRVYREPIVPAL